jgi:hypothetical protein
VNSAGCNINLSADDNGECIPYFSIPAGGPVKTCNDNVNWLCMNMYCGTDPAGKTMCLDPIALGFVPPLQCTVNSNCTSRKSYYTGSILESNCTCGYSSASSAFCSLFYGDPLGQDYLAIKKTWYRSLEILSCSSMARHSRNCKKQVWSPKQLNSYDIAETKFLNYPQLLNLDSCAKAVLWRYFLEHTTDFDQLYVDQDQEEQDSAVLVGLVSLIALL